MDETTIVEIEKVKMKNPILIEGLPGIGLVGKIAADHMIDELGAKQVAQLISPHFPHQPHRPHDYWKFVCLPLHHCRWRRLNEWLPDPQFPLPGIPITAHAHEPQHQNHKYHPSP